MKTLNENELAEINGAWAPVIAVALIAAGATVAVAAAGWAAANWTDIKKGASDFINVK